MAWVVNRGPYQFQVRYKETVNGVTKQVTVGTYNTEAEANAKVAELDVAKSLGRKIDNKLGKIKVRDALKMYEDTEAKLKDSYELSRKYNYRTWLDDKNDQKLGFLDEYVVNIDVTHIKQYMAMRLKKISKSTLNRELNELRAFFNWFRIHYSVKNFYNPVSDVKKPKANDERNRIIERSSDEEYRFLDACKKSGTRGLYYAVMALMELGCRRKEFVTIKWSDIKEWNVPGKIPYILLEAKNTKTKKPRPVPLSLLAVEAIKGLEKVHEELKETEERNRHQRKNDEPIHDYRYLMYGLQPNSISQAFRKARIEAGVEDFRLHDLRHVFITRLIHENPNLSPVEVAKIAGNSLKMIMERYFNVTPQALGEKMRKGQ